MSEEVVYHQYILLEYSRLQPKIEYCYCSIFFSYLGLKYPKTITKNSEIRGKIDVRIKNTKRIII